MTAPMGRDTLTELTERAGVHATTRLECLERYVAALSEYRKANKALYRAALLQPPSPTVPEAQRAEEARVSLKVARRRYFEACREYAAQGEVCPKTVDVSSNELAPGDQWLGRSRMNSEGTSDAASGEAAPT